MKFCLLSFHPAKEKRLRPMSRTAGNRHTSITFIAPALRLQDVQLLHTKYTFIILTLCPQILPSLSVPRSHPHSLFPDPPLTPCPQILPSLPVPRSSPHPHSLSPDPPLTLCPQILPSLPVPRSSPHPHSIPRFSPHPHSLSLDLPSPSLPVPRSSPHPRSPVHVHSCGTDKHSLA